MLHHQSLTVHSIQVLPVTSTAQAHHWTAAPCQSHPQPATLDTKDSIQTAWCRHPWNKPGAWSGSPHQACSDTVTVRQSDSLETEGLIKQRTGGWRWSSPPSGSRCTGRAGQQGRIAVRGDARAGLQVDLLDHLLVHVAGVGPGVQQPVHYELAVPGVLAEALRRQARCPSGTGLRAGLWR